MKKILSFVVCLSLLAFVLTVFPAPVGAASDSGIFGAGMSWAFDPEEGVLTVSGEGPVLENDSIYWVLNINRSRVSEIEVTSGVTSLAPNTFDGFPNLVSVYLPDTLTDLPSDAFSGCPSLAEIVIDAENPVYETVSGCVIEKGSGTLIFGCNSSVLDDLDVASIADGAFCGYEGITRVFIPAGVTYIGESAFSGCVNIAEITVDPLNSVYRAEGNCLIEIATETVVLGCSSSVIPDGVVSIGAHAFKGYPGITEIALPESVVSIGEGAFEGCSSLSSVVLTDSITEIPDTAFAYCSSLETIVIPDTVTYIGCGAFAGCVSLAEIEFPSSLETVGDGALFECASLKTVEFPDSVTYLGAAALCGCESLESVKLPDGIEEIPASLFESCFSLTEIYMPESLKTVGECAFVDCMSLTRIDLPDGITEIGDNAFGFCTALESVDLPDSLESIGYGAFANCESLEVLTLPETLLEIGSDAFIDSEMILTEYDNALYLGTEDNPYYALVEAADDFINGCEIHPDTKIICDLAFEGNEGITEVEIPDGVKAIGDGAFDNCRGIESVRIPKSIVRIGEGAFGGCTGLAKIVVPIRVLIAAPRVFFGCSGINDVVCDATSEEWEEYEDQIDSGFFGGASIQVGVDDGVLPGDVNGDGVVTAQDMRLLKQYLSGLVGDDDIVSANADVNGDGDITAKDCRALAALFVQ